MAFHMQRAREFSIEHVGREQMTINRVIRSKSRRAQFYHERQRNDVVSGG
jgi:hypothetical protein